MQDINVIAMDGKFDLGSFHKALPGMSNMSQSFIITRVCHFNYWCFSELNNIVLVKNHHNLKTKVWPEHLGLSKYAQLQRHVDGAFNCRTKDEIEQHWSDLYHSLADRPQDVRYFQEYFDCSELIAQYKIFEVRESLGMVTSSNPEEGHASNVHAVYIDLSSRLKWYYVTQSQQRSNNPSCNNSILLMEFIQVTLQLNNN